MKKIVVTILTIGMFSCMSGEPLVQKKADNNQTYKVDYLFEHEGCKMYRFYDRGAYVYFSNCTGDVTAIKNDSTRNTIRTIVKNTPD